MVTEFYNLSKDDREKIVLKIGRSMKQDLETGKLDSLLKYASSEDTYIRKAVYLKLGKLYKNQEKIRPNILDAVKTLLMSRDESVRQTAVYALGEIGKVNAEIALPQLQKSLSDEHHSVRNAVIGAFKQMGEKNPKPTFEFINKLMSRVDPEVKRELIHGMELRGRTHPEELLPTLKNLQNDESKKVQDTVIHVLGQISYKEGCLEKVASEVKGWGNKEFVGKVFQEILDVHKRYEKFSAKTYDEAKQYLVN